MADRHPIVRACIGVALMLAFFGAVCPVTSGEGPLPRLDEPDFTAVRSAMTDLIATFGDEYPDGPEYLARLAALEAASRAGDMSVPAKLKALRREALLANPLMDFDKLILLKRKRGQLGLPTNHQCNACLDQLGYDNELAILSPVRPDGRLNTLFRPSNGAYVGEMDLHFDADRLLFAMPNGRSWQIHEIRINGSGLRQVSRQQEGVDNFDACYLPDGRIVFVSTASYTAVPCWHGKQRACCLYVMNADGTGVRQLCYDQDLDLHPAVLPTGQVIFSRWEYTGTLHHYVRPLMVMNPDGTLQRAVYGSNSYYPNALYFPKSVPGAPNKIVAILSGHHGVNRAGGLALLDLNKGWYEDRGIVHLITNRNEPPDPVIRDNLVEAWWPKFLHPDPLSDKYFLAAAQFDEKSPWGIYLIDIFGNMVALQVDPKFDFFEPIAGKKTPRPLAIADRVDLQRDDAVIHLHDVYAGPGLAGVPQGTIKRLRIVAYHYGYPGMAGPDKIGRAGPWDAMRIVGTVPVHDDGSVAFRVPANTPICVQPLDAEGKAVQLMRSWYTAMPGERASCIGCHEQPKDSPTVRYDLAATRPPVEIEPWYGPARGFDFEREVQPVLDKYCVGCHNGQPRADGLAIADLRSEQLVPNYQGLPLSLREAKRLHPELRNRHDRFPLCKPPTELLGDRKMLYTPAYDALIPYIRRVNTEDFVGLLVPGEYHADTSELVQMLQKGHYNVRLDREGWDRLITWIDLNGPCHGTWGDVCTIPDGADRRRRELARMYGGPKEDPETVPAIRREPVPPIMPDPLPKPKPQLVRAPGWPFDAQEARRRQQAAGTLEKTVDLGDGVTLKLVRIPAGEFVMGATDGEPDEYPLAKVSIPDDFWVSACEITNEQFRRFDPSHQPGLFSKRPAYDDPGMMAWLDGPKQPVVRVSWERAVDFCQWLSKKTGMRCGLPTESQWEYACRAGSSADFYFGDLGDDFSGYANFADKAISPRSIMTTGGLMMQDIPSDRRYDDRAVATANVGGYQPNAWGLYDMHGNVAEWTRSTDKPYPYRDDDRNSLASHGRKIVRGGSFYDRPQFGRSAFRLSYLSWQRVHNVGFRVVSEISP